MSKSFFDSMTNIKIPDANLLNINQMSSTSTDSDFYNIEYFKILNSANSFLTM